MEAVIVEIKLRNAHEATLTAPSGGILVSIKIQVEIDPPDGAILIYAAPDYAQPTFVEGPSATLDLATTEPKIYFQPVRGAQKVRIQTLGYRENQNL